MCSENNYTCQIHTQAFNMLQSIQHAATWARSKTWFISEDTGQVKDLVSFQGNISSHQTQHVQDCRSKSAWDLQNSKNCWVLRNSAVYRAAFRYTPSYLLSTAFLKLFLLFLRLFHALHSSLMAPSEETWGINVWMRVIFIVRNLFSV